MTRPGDTNILKLHELHEKCVNFYKTPKHELTREKYTTRHKKNTITTWIHELPGLRVRIINLKT